jgi:hypothetical protein
MKKMEKSIFRIAYVAAIVLLACGFTAKSQEPFYNTEWKDGRIISVTKHEMGYSGLYEKKAISEYTYDEDGDFVMKEVFVWNGKYVWYEKGGIRIPDYSKKNWIPDSRIVCSIDLTSNIVTYELFKWNSWKKEYKEPIEKLIYKVEPNKFIYYAYQKGNKYTEFVNNTGNTKLLAEFYYFAN